MIQLRRLEIKLLILHKLDRSWLIVWTFCALVIGIAITLVQVEGVIAEEPTIPAFRIVDVRTEQGQLVIEVQHFNPDGSDWFHEVYAFQGREAFNFSRQTNEDGLLIREDGSVAPSKVGADGETLEQYLPYDVISFGPSEDGRSLKVVHIDNAYGSLPSDLVVGLTDTEVKNIVGIPEIQKELVWEYLIGPGWKYHDYLSLDEASILSPIIETHRFRSNTGWYGGKGRVILPDMTFSSKDKEGSKLLASHFEYLAYTMVESGLSSSPPFNMQYIRTHTPKVFGLNGEEYIGEVSNLATIQHYFERVDLRTQDSKSYQISAEEIRVDFRESQHFMGPDGKWLDSRLEFRKVPNEDVWLMSSHPLYNVYGTLNHISMISPEGEVGGARWYTPSPINYDGDKAWYEHDGLRWTYNLTPKGIKLTSEVISPRGPKEYSFVFLPLGTTNPLRIDASGNATTVSEYDLGDLGPEAAYFFYDFEDAEYTGPQVVVPKAVIIGADGEYYPGGDWEIVDDYTIKFAFNDDTLPAQAFPYTIDPTTTFATSSAMEDGHVGIGLDGVCYNTWAYFKAGSCAGGVSDVDYASTAGTVRLRSSNVSNQYKQISRFHMAFDTSSLPDEALITSANLNFTVQSKNETWEDAHSLTLVEHDSASTTSYVLADRVTANLTGVSVILGNPMAWDAIDFTSYYNRNYLELTGAGIGHIDKKGVTKLALTTLADARNEEPTWVSYQEVALGIWTNEAGSPAAPELSVTYRYVSLYACEPTKVIIYSQSTTDSGGPGVDGYLNNVRGPNYADHATWKEMTTDAVSKNTGVAGEADEAHSNYGYASASIVNTHHSPYDKYSYLYRGVVSFDTSSIPDDAVITKGEVALVAMSNHDTYTDPGYVVITELNLADLTVIDTNDWSNFGSIASNALALQHERGGFPSVIGDTTTGWTGWSSKIGNKSYSRWTLNQIGLNHIRGKDNTAFGVQILADALGEGPPGNGYGSNSTFQFVEANFNHSELSPGNTDPRLTLEYITPCAELSGTVSDSSVSVFYPGLSGAGEPTDGWIHNYGSGDRHWREVTTDAGLLADDNNVDYYLGLMYISNAATGSIGFLYHGYNFFDTSSLPAYSDDCTVEQDTGYIYPATGNTGGDGYISNNPNSYVWDLTISGPGSSLEYNDPSAITGVYASTTTDIYDMTQRGFFFFNTSTVPSNAIITKATIGLVPTGKWDSYTPHPIEGATTGTAGFYSWTPSNLVGGSAAITDYDETNRNILSNVWKISDINVAGTVYLDWKLNSAGLDWINKSGSGLPYTSFMFLDNYQAMGEEPQPWGSTKQVRLQYRTTEDTSYKPRLKVYYDLPCPGIHSATLGFVPTETRDGLGDSSISFVTAFDTSSNTTLQTYDFGNLDYVKIAPDLPFNAITTDSTTYNYVGLNTRGLSLIKDGGTSGVTKFGSMITNEADNKPPTWALLDGASADPGRYISILAHSADSGGSYKPKLTVTHGDSSTAHIDAGDIIAGGKDIVLTLNGAHWHPAGAGAGEFDVTRQDIIDGITGSHGAGAVNWNEAVRDNIAVGTVARTDDRTVTITLAAYAAYAPATTETITATINDGITSSTTIYPIATGADDGFTKGSGASWPPGSPVVDATNSRCHVSKTLWASVYYSYTCFMQWNTAGIPDDAVVLDAKLRFNNPSGGDGSGRAMLGEWGDASTWFPVAIGNHVAGNVEVGQTAFNHDITAIPIGAYINIDLSDPDTYVNKTGYTALRYGVSGTGAPGPGNEVNGIDIATEEDVSLDPPQLILTYTSGASSTDSNLEITSNPVFLIDKLPFEFTSFTPTAASNASSFNMTITGSGLPEHPFGGTEAVTLIKSGESNIVCTSVSGTGGSSVVVACDATGAETAAPDWDVKVVNGTGLNDTKSAALDLFQIWSSTVNGGSFSDSGSDYAVFAHTASPYFTVQAFDEVDKTWGSASAAPGTLPAAAGMDGQIVSNYVGKDRLVVGTAANANYLWAYVFDPATGVVSGTPDNPTSVGSIGVNDLDIGWYDNIVVAATTDSAGVYMYDIDPSAALSSFFTSTIAAPGTPPGAECKAVDINYNASYVAVGCTTSPYLHVWAITNGGAGTPAWSTKSAATTGGNIPSGSIIGIEFSADGSHIAVATDSSPYLEVYPFSAGTVGTKVSPTALAGPANDVAWTNEGATETLLAASHFTTPYVTIYPFDTILSTFGTKLADPTPTLPAGTGYTVSFHPNDDAIFIGHATTPFMTSYNFTGLSDEDYEVYRYMANFDTSYLPDDAVITAATLSIYVNTVFEGTDWQLLVEDGENGSEPLVVGDYDYGNWTTQVSTGGVTASAIVEDEYTDIPLNVFSGIKVDGISQFILRHEEDIGNSAPTAIETVDIELGGSVTFPGPACTAPGLPWSAVYAASSTYNLCNSPNVPKLTITYTSASNPVSDLSLTFTNALTVSTDGTYTTSVLNKGPLTQLAISGVDAAVTAIDLGRVFTDNSNDWSFLKSTSPAKPFSYMRSTTMYQEPEIASLGTIELWYQFEGLPGAQMIDRSRTSEGYSDDETSTFMSFPTDNSSVTVATASAISPSGASALEMQEGEPGAPDIVSPLAEDIMEGTVTNENVPLGSWWSFIEEQGGMPEGTIATILALVGTIFAGLIAYRSFSSIAATFIVTIGALAALSTMMGGVFPWWMVLTFGLTAGVFVFSRRAYV